MAAAAALIGSYILIFGRPWNQSIPPYRIDLDVYRLGGQAFLDGADLYGRLPDTQIGANLPFTYPPISAVLFSPIAVIPFWLANILFTAATLACLAVVIRLVLRELGVARSDELTWLTVGGLAVMMWVEPVFSTIGFGQINVFLMTLVVVDVIVGRGRWWQGSLIGLAIAIKLTPAVFLAYFLVRRDWRALITGVVATLVATGVGFAFLPKASAQYWTETILDPSRIGGLAYVSNQSINGALVRLGVSEGGGMIWFGICAVPGLGLLVVVRRLVSQGHALAALLTMAFYVLLASPVSWSHHYVWAVPAMILLVMWALNSPKSGALWGMAVAGAVVYFGRIIWLMPHEEGREREWNWYQQILGNAHLLWGLAFLVFVSWYAFRGPKKAVAGAIA